eukprot:4677317-Amphidinium_carterae.3
MSRRVLCSKTKSVQVHCRSKRAGGGLPAGHFSQERIFSSGNLISVLDALMRYSGAKEAHEHN